MLLELPLSLVLQPARLAIVITEAGDRDIEIAVAIEIRGAGIGDPRHAIGDVVRRELLAAVVLEHDDRTDPVVVGEEEAERSNEQIEIAGLVEIADFDVGGSGDTRNRLLGIGASGGLTDPADDTAQRVTDDDVVQAVTIEISDGHVRDLRPLLAFRGIADWTRGQERGRLCGCGCGRGSRRGGRRLSATACDEANGRGDRQEQTDQGPRTTDGPRTTYGPGTKDQGQGTIRARLWRAFRGLGRSLRDQLFEERRGAFPDHASAATPAALPHREIEWCESSFVLQRQRGAALGEEFHHRIAATDGAVQRGVAGIVEGIDVHATLEQQLAGFDGAFRRGHNDADALTA